MASVITIRERKGREMSQRDHIVQEAAGTLRVLLGVGGLIAAVIGVLILAWPEKSGMFIAAVLAVYAIIAGVVYLAVGIFGRAVTRWFRAGHLALGLLYGIAGVIVLTNLQASTALLAFLIGITVGIVWIIEGVVAFTTLSNSRVRGWTVFYAVISVLGGASLLFQPLFGAVVLWWLMGIALVVLGVTQVVRAIRYKPVQA